MPYWLESDTFHEEPIFVALAGGKWGTPLYDRLKAAYADLKSLASHNTSNGYLLEYEAIRYCRGQRKVLDLLCSRALDDRHPLLHRKGDVCECLGEEWTDGYDFRLHAFLKRNPARSEVQRNRAMKADAKDARLRALVYERDAGCCRYCRSGPLPPNMGRAKDRRKVRTFDHVDPDKPAQPDGTGYVLACDRCNSEKGHRTPAEADMALLPEPTDHERRDWLARDLTVFDRSATAPRPLRDGDSGAVDDRDHGAVPAAVAGAVPDAIGAADVHPEQAATDRYGTPERSQKGDGPGRAAETVANGGHPPPRQPPEAQPRRTSAHPDIYHRRSRASPPPVIWPEGYTRERPRSSEHDDQEGPAP